MCRSAQDKTNAGDGSSANNEKGESAPDTIEENVSGRENDDTARTAAAANKGMKTKTKRQSLRRRRRGKREKEADYEASPASSAATKQKKRKVRKRNKDEQPGGGVEAMLPSLAILVVLLFGFLASRGFRGRSSVAGIDLGTTNSVVCVQAPDGDMDCISDPYSGSPIIPSVVAFVDAGERPVGASSKASSLLDPHPTHVVVGAAAKERIDAHPHRTLYNAKRVMGRRIGDEAVKELRREVEFDIVPGDRYGDNVLFRVPEYGGDADSRTVHISPQQVGSYVVHHLMKITKEFLGHENVQSAVIAVPAKFDALQRQRTVEAFTKAGVTVRRILEEPTAAALAYGLHQKDGVEHVLVYDFGGGTLDISMLHIASNGGYCDVMGSDGDDRLGGADFDAVVAHLLEERHEDVLRRHQKFIAEEHMEAFSTKCHKVTTATPLCSRSSFHTLGEKLKIQLSRSLQERIDQGQEDNDDLIAQLSCLAIPESINTKVDDSDNDDADLCESLIPLPLSLSLPEYNAAARPLWDRVTLPITRLLEDLTLSPDDVDEIVLVGGTTRLPQIRELVKRVFTTKLKPFPDLNAHIDPDLTVAYGAASVND